MVGMSVWPGLACVFSVHLTDSVTWTASYSFLKKEQKVHETEVGHEGVQRSSPAPRAAQLPLASCRNLNTSVHLMLWAPGDSGKPLLDSSDALAF